MLAWGVYSVRGYAVNSLVEWFRYSWQGSRLFATVAFIKNNTPPDFTYADFAQTFRAQLFDDQCGRHVQGIRCEVHLHHEALRLIQQLADGVLVELKLDGRWTEGRSGRRAGECYPKTCRHTTRTLTRFRRMVSSAAPRELGERIQDEEVSCFETYSGTLRTNKQVQTGPAVVGLRLGSTRLVLE